MKKTSNQPNKPFYLMSVDILQGLFVFVMVIGHVTLWWNPELDSQFPNLPLLTQVLWKVALILPAGFLFWYGFNVTNSLLRRKYKDERIASRSRLLKRSAIFFIFAIFTEFITAFFVFPELIMNYVLTWGLFHMFAFSTFSLLFIFEISWFFEQKLSWNSKKVSLITFLTILAVSLVFYLLFHDYTPNSPMDYYVDLNLSSILQYVIFEKGQSPIIPFLIYSFSGGLLAAYLDLPNVNKAIAVKKAPLSLIVGLFIFIIGIFLLQIEPYVSPPVLYPSSSPNVFISIGSHIILVTGFILILDLDLINIKEKTHKFTNPIVLLSQITLTVYVIHNIAFILPSDHPFIRSVILNEDGVLLFGFLYTVLFIIIAFFWYKWNFKYSFEWFISKIH